jgi:hypothetical protein
MSELILPISSSGAIDNPALAATQGETRKLWAAYVYRRWTTVKPGGFLVGDDTKHRIDVRHVVLGAYLAFGAEIRPANGGGEWSKFKIVYLVTAKEDHAMTLQAVKEDDVPTLPDLDPMSHPGVTTILLEIEQTRTYLARLERLILRIARKDQPSAMLKPHTSP